MDFSYRPISEGGPIELKPVASSTVPHEQPNPVYHGNNRRFKKFGTRLLFDLFCLSWLAPIVILLYLNYTKWIIGSGIACRFPSYKDDCNIWSNITVQLTSLDKKDHEIQGALQIVAKALEVWFTIVASSLMLDLAIILAVSNSGLPIGHFMTYLEFTSVTILWSPTFWTASRGKKDRCPWYKPPKLWLWAFVPLAAVLCIASNLMGPATAVLSIPTLGWSELTFPKEWVVAGTRAALPPTEIDSVAGDGGCPADELAAGDYTCTNYFSVPLDELSSGLWWRRSLDNQGHLYVPPVVPYLSISFTFNQSDATNLEEITWMPSREMLRWMSDDFVDMLLSRASDNYTHAKERLGSELDPTLYDHYRNSLDMETRRNGPTLGVKNTCSTGKIVEFDIAPGKPVRCYTRIATSTPGEFIHRCIPDPSGDSWGDIGHLSYSGFTIGDNTIGEGINLREATVDVYSVEKAYIISDSDAHCITEPDNSDCDWATLLPTDSDAGDFEWSTQFYEYAMPNYSATNDTIICLAYPYYTVADYVLQVSPSTFNTTIVEMQILTDVNITHANVHADWNLAAWSTTRGGAVNGDRTVAYNLINALEPLTQTPPPTNAEEQATFERHIQWFLDQQITMTIQGLSLVGISYSENETYIKEVADDPRFPRQVETKRFRVWAYGNRSRTFRMGSVVAIFGCVCVVARTVISLIYRQPQPSALEVLAAALRYEYRGDLTGLVSETQVGRVTYGFVQNPADKGKIANPPLLEPK
ncbi:hypothetical protein FQN51_002280 [Onygenales sp. PD_10]|nr:hypothetical protein FQN51_002280 [Onygenales sp. PD_10]